MSEVANGGFGQFFFNSTGVLAPEAVLAFQSIGLPDLASVLQQAMENLGLDYPRDRYERQLRLEHLEDRDSAFGKLEDQFYALIDSEGGGWLAAADAYAVALSNSHSSGA